jgi:hypothetical protein
LPKAAVRVVQMIAFFAILITAATVGGIIYRAVLVPVWTWIISG